MCANTVKEARKKSFKNKKVLRAYLKDWQTHIVKFKFITWNIRARHGAFHLLKRSAYSASDLDWK